MSDFKKIGVIGAGSWGTALAQLISSNAEDVLLIPRSAEMAEAINEKKQNPKYLKDLLLRENISASISLQKAVSAEVLILAVPTSAIRNTAQQLKENGIPPETVLISVSKGIERGTGLRMSEIIEEILPENPIAALSGPNHAEEVSLDQPTCTVIGCRDHALAKSLQPLFTSSMFRAYTCDDIIGVEWGGAMKNIFAIAAGIAQGLKLGDNAIAALVTRGLAEMKRVGTAFGAQQATFSGLSGVGDLMTTCYSHHSRNHQVGLALAKGLTVQEAEEQLKMVAEGVRNTQSIYEQVQLKGLDAPLIHAVYSVLYQGVHPGKAIEALFTRELKAEI